MILGQLLLPSATFICDQVTSKKKMLEKISQVMSEYIDTSDKRIFDSLITRERLGTTALGEGVATPHGRSPACKEITAVFMLLESAIDYDALDGKPVDIIFALLVPENADEEHLCYLGKIAELLSDESLLAKLRHAHSDESLYQLLELAAKQLP